MTRAASASATPDSALPSVTVMEADVIRRVVHNDYDRPVWAWTLAGGKVDQRQIGGVVSSLVQKGLVDAWDYAPGEGVVDLTPLGERVYAALEAPHV